VTVRQTLIRPAIAADLPTIAGIFAANGEPVTTHTGETPYLDSLLAIARVLVAEREDAIVGFGAVVPVGQITHLADLFVAPPAHGTGVGQALLAELYGDAYPRTTFASDDARALPLYVRSGMLPGWPNLYLVGESIRLPRTALRTGPATPEECAALELAATGRQRAAIQWSSGRPGSQPILVRDATDEAVGFALVRERWRGPGRAVDRVVVADGADPLEVVLTVLASQDDGRPLQATLPGPHPALRHLLEAGFRIADKDTFMASEPGLIDPTRQVVDPTLL
jgi:GNAT superfamily N-acetyltransferase